MPENGADGMWRLCFDCCKPGATYNKRCRRGGINGIRTDDLKALCPSEEELLDAAKWCMEQDVSEGFRFIIKEMLTQCGWKNVSIQI